LEIRLYGNGDHGDYGNGKKVAKMQRNYSNGSKKVASLQLFCCHYRNKVAFSQLFYHHRNHRDHHYHRALSPL